MEVEGRGADNVLLVVKVMTQFTNS